MAVLMGVAVRNGSQLTLNLLAGRPEVARALEAVSDSIFDKLLPAFEAGTWRPGMPAPISGKP